MTLKLGFIGTGGIAAYHLNNLAKMDDVEVIGFTDLVMERAIKSASEWSHAKAYSKAQDMLDDLKLDAVYICVPPMAHGEVERLIIERGIPFLVEKPLCITNQLPTEIAAEVAAKNVLSSVGFHWRYSDSLQMAKEILSEHTPGMALGYWMGGMPPTPWWRLQHASGGQFVEQTIHITDTLRFLCGEVVEVYAAFSQRGSYNQDEVTIPDVGTVTMKLENGMVATISNTCQLPIDGRVGLDIYTTNGILEISGDRFKLIEPGRTVERVSQTNSLFNEDEAFLNAVRTGDRSFIRSDYADALKTHNIVIAANESAHSGKPVRLIP